MVSKINTNDGLKEPTRGYQDCNTCQILIFGRNVKVIESLHTCIII